VPAPPPFEVKNCFVLTFNVKKNFAQFLTLLKVYTCIVHSITENRWVGAILQGRERRLAN